MTEKICLGPTTKFYIQFGSAFLLDIFYYLAWPCWILLSSSTTYPQLWAERRSHTRNSFYISHPGFRPRPACRAFPTSSCRIFSDSIPNPYPTHPDAIPIPIPIQVMPAKSCNLLIITEAEVHEDQSQN